MDFFYFFAILPNILFPFADTAPHYWRFMLHLLGSMFLVILLWVFTPRVSRATFLLLVISITVFFGAQEFFIHPTLYAQSAVKGVVDFLTWTIPPVTYLLLTQAQKK